MKEAKRNCMVKIKLFHGIDDRKRKSCEGKSVHHKNEEVKGILFSFNFSGMLQN